MGAESKLVVARGERVGGWMGWLKGIKRYELINRDVK